MASASNRVLTDHDEIRRWAEERGGRPSCVKQTGGEGDVGILRIDFPGYSGENSLQEIEWEEWLDKFDERGLAVVVQDSTARGQRSNFNKLISRDTAEGSEKGHRSTKRGSSSKGRKSTSRRRSNSTQRSRNQNRSEGRSDQRRTTGRSAEGAGRSSSRSASTRASSSRGKRAPSRAGSARSTRTSTTTSRGKSGDKKSPPSSGRGRSK